MTGPALFAAPVDVDIRFYNQKIVYADSKIPIKIEITNTSSRTYRFKLAAERAFSVDFSVKTLTNLEAPRADQFIIARNSNQPLFFRDVSLDPGEQFAFIENLSDYVKLNGAGVYVIQGLFFPDLYTGDDSNVIASNELTLDVHPGRPSSNGELEAILDEDTGAILKQERLAPDEVVAYTIRARQKSQWNKFFLYVDLANLMLEQPELKRRYDRASDQEQRSMVARFKSDLMKQTIDPEVSLLPSDFTIEKTDYTPREATVLVTEKFAFPTYTEVKEYTYYLHRPDAVWLIYNYTVRNTTTQ